MPRSSASRRPAPRQAPELCPCGTGEQYSACCARFHSSSADAPTAEALMRSRYSAFALGDAAYLLRTWHSSTRPRRLELDRQRTWVQLQVVGKAAGGLFDAEGSVHFIARYRVSGVPGVQEENSSFIREAGAWRYVGRTERA